jgi:hypothetical protein
VSPDRPHLGLRFGFIALWIASLLWLPVEDPGPLNARILAALACLLLAARGSLRFRRLTLPAWAGLGLTAGLLINPIAAGLMIIKSGLHGHGAPDFDFAVLAAVLADTPIYGLGGLLIGSGLFYLRK